MMERLPKMLETTLIAFTGSMVCMYIYLLVFRIEVIHVHHLTAAFAMNILLSLTQLIFLSKRELSRRQMFVRNCIHFVICLAVTLTIATFMGWVMWSQPISIVVFAGMVMFIYGLMSLRELYQSKKLADKLNEKLKEKYSE